MNRPNVLAVGLCLGLVVLAAGCGKGTASVSAQDTDTGPHPGAVEQDMDPNNVKVDDAGKFPTVAAGVYLAASELKATGVVSPDVSRLRRGGTGTGRRGSARRGRGNRRRERLRGKTWPENELA